MGHPVLWVGHPPKERKPYEATQRYRHYVGLQVCWPLTVCGVWETIEPGRSTLRFESPEVGEHHSVYVEIYIEEYPKLKVVDQGHRAWVEGNISRVDAGEVSLGKGAKVTLE
jgi:hypothetical protein